MSAFSPTSGAVSTYRVTVGITSTTLTVPARPSTVRVFNNTPANIVYIEVAGPTAVVPTAGGAPGSMPLAGGAGSIPLLLEKGNATQISLIASGAGTDVYVTLGLGDTVG
jgi:hypothetical protein